MAYHDDLLQQAWMLVRKEPRRPKQASLRRAVSSAYYALFHLLIREAVANWNRPSLRDTLGRAFDHGIMKTASRRYQNLSANPSTGHDPRVVKDLKDIASAFVQLQEKRHTADYDNGTFWTRTEALSLVAQAQRSFDLWKNIRNEPLAQEYLLALLVKKRD